MTTFDKQPINVQNSEIADLSRQKHFVEDLDAPPIATPALTAHSLMRSPLPITRQMRYGISTISELLLAAFVLLILCQGSGSAAIALATTSSTTSQLSLAPSPTPMTSPSTDNLTATTDLTTTLALNYTNAISASTSQNWPRTAQLFLDVYNLKPDYLDVDERLSVAYYNWGLQALQKGDAAGALEKLNTALVIEPLYEPALKEQPRTILYWEVQVSLAQKQLQSAIDKLEQLRGQYSDDEYLKTTELLYTTYMSRGLELEEQNAQKEALEIYEKATTLSNGDRSAAKARINELNTVLNPWRFKASILSAPSDAAVQCGRKFDSKIWGVVKDSNGRGIGNASVQVRSSDKRNRFPTRTNSQGGFTVPGLGCTDWDVMLLSIPGAPKAGVQGSIRVKVNGGLYSGVEIEFRRVQ